MKQIPVDECPAGIYLDVAVAKAQYHGEHLVIDFKHRLFSTSDRAISCIKLSRYSIDIAAAWILAPDVLFDYELRCWIKAWQTGNCVWDREGNGEFLVNSEADAAPLVITRTYLKAKGIEFVEIPEELCHD